MKTFKGLRLRVEEAHRRLALGEPRGLDLYSLIRLRDHLARLEREAPMAVLAIYVSVESRLSPLKAFEVLAGLESLPSVSLEASRIIRDSKLGLRTLYEQLMIEAKQARGVWGRLLGALASSEASGLDPRLAMRDLVISTLRDLKTGYEKMARRFQALISSASVIFGAFPMMLTVMLSILASGNMYPVLAATTLFNAFLATTWLLTVDSQVPDILDYKVFYRKNLTRWLPIGAAVGALVYAGFVYFPGSLVYRSSLALCLGALTFSLPVSIRWRLQSRVQSELMEGLPVVLREVAAQVEKGYSPHQALENVASMGSSSKYVSKLLSLIIKEARVYGSLREAYSKIADLLPKPWKVSLELLALGEEMGSGASAIHALADSMAEYVATMRELRRLTSPYKWLSLAMSILTLSLLAYISRMVMVKMAQIGALMAAGGATVTMPFTPPTPEELPKLLDVVFLQASANSIILSIVTGKTVGWRMGDSIVEVLKASAAVIAFTLFMWLAG